MNMCLTFDKKAAQTLADSKEHSMDGSDRNLSRQDFGEDFLWGVATSSYQIEGAVAEGGRGPSIWDTFTSKKGKVKNGHTAHIACDFYHRYEADLALAKSLGFKAFRFSIAWSRIFPDGYGEVNQAGVDFYNKVINHCLELGITPWATLYHWDLPQALENLGGWTNRKILDWFSEYALLCAQSFGDRVKNWIVLNEPAAVAGLGYTTGLHAPGRKGVWNFPSVVHHLAMCQAAGGRILRQEVGGAFIGTTYSCSFVYPNSQKQKDVRAAARADAIMNRLFVEPALGLGYPVDAFSFLSNINRFVMPGDMESLQFDFDFIGLQNYFSVVVRHSYLAPVLWLKEVPPALRNVPVTAMGWEIDPTGLVKIIEQFSKYKGIKKLLISENGAAFEDVKKDSRIDDSARTQYFQAYLNAVLKAREKGFPVEGYFAWTLTDNFEWAEGYDARFGLVHVDFETQERTVKDSGRWFQSFLQNT